MQFQEDREKLAVGDVKMTMYRVGQDGSTETLREEEYHNLIVSKASVMMARRMAPSNATGPITTNSNHIANGFTHLALGTGVGTGSLQTPEASTVALDKLRTEYFRKPISSWTFLDGSNNPTATPTNVLELTTDITETEAVAALTEMGLFGGDAATATANSGHLFNHKVFAVWNKPNDARLKIIWRITF
ncbi:MAG TPA: hypothetical protein VK464_14010 [Symbiobacteriaceae bacterium]|jgi:hypothetical protein|nr:hypothetical protein [Symbiobacteriaceae bacterium]